MPGWLLVHSGISSNAKCCYMLLKGYAKNKNEAFPGVGLMAEQLCTSPASIKRFTRELVTAGLIKKKSRFNRSSISIFIDPLGRSNLIPSVDQKWSPELLVFNTNDAPNTVGGLVAWYADEYRKVVGRANKMRRPQDKRAAKALLEDEDPSMVLEVARHQLKCVQYYGKTLQKLHERWGDVLADYMRSKKATSTAKVLQLRQPDRSPDHRGRSES